MLYFFTVFLASGSFSQSTQSLLVPTAAALICLAGICFLGAPVKGRFLGTILAPGTLPSTSDFDLTNILDLESWCGNFTFILSSTFLGSALDATGFVAVVARAKLSSLPGCVWDCMLFGLSILLSLH